MGGHGEGKAEEEGEWQVGEETEIGPNTLNEEDPATATAVASGGSGPSPVRRAAHSTQRLLKGVEKSVDYTRASVVDYTLLRLSSTPGPPS